MAVRIRPLAGEPLGVLDGSSALNLENAELLVHFAIEVAEAAELEALLHARRSMLREERTRGRESDEPALEEAVFTRSDISWKVRPDQRDWCLRKLEQLSARANRVLCGVPGA